MQRIRMMHVELQSDVSVYSFTAAHYLSTVTDIHLCSHTY